tara:strand:- start:1284 stop:1454 length:171 start_codon:yes stop_codon:yes gene_type:complete
MLYAVFLISLHSEQFPSICVNELMRENIELFTRYDAMHDDSEAFTYTGCLPVSNLS